jgi:hypothetical protein
MLSLLVRSLKLSSQRVHAVGKDAENRAPQQAAVFCRLFADHRNPRLTNHRFHRTIMTRWAAPLLLTSIFDLEILG